VCDAAAQEDTMQGDKKSLYERLGGYDAISAVANDLLARLRADPQLGRFWAHRGEDGITREKQLLIDFLCSNAGGPVYYRGRDMVLTHRGMRISESDWNVFLRHAGATLAKFDVPAAEQQDRGIRTRPKKRDCRMTRFGSGASRAG
jgi:hemoglobin